MPKSQVAKESAARFNPHAKILAHFANIKNAEFGPDFFRRFDLVMNALDNLGLFFHFPCVLIFQMHDGMLIDCVLQPKNLLLSLVLQAI